MDRRTRSSRSVRRPAHSSGCVGTGNSEPTLSHADAAWLHILHATP